MTAAATCKAGTLTGRMCRRRHPAYVVVGDPYRDRFCKQHVAEFAARPGASGIARHLNSGALLPIDPDGNQLHRTRAALIVAFTDVRCQEGYERTRRAVLAALDVDGAGVKHERGLHPELSAAMTAARHHLARIAATQQGVPA